MSNQVQPLDVYPSPNVIQPQPQQQQNSSHHSNGSFGPAYIVLGIIFVLAIIATILGRICSRRGHGSKAAEQPHHGGHGGGKNKKTGKSTARPHDHKVQSGPEGDIEFGFHEKRIPKTSKVGHDNNNIGDHSRGPKLPLSYGGEHKGRAKFADDHIEFRPGH